MSGREQAAAVRLLMAAREVLTDPLSSDAERQRIAAQIGRFVDHEPVAPETNPLCGRCGSRLSNHEDRREGRTLLRAACPKGGGVFTHATEEDERRLGERRQRLVEEHDE